VSVWTVTFLWINTLTPSANLLIITSGHYAIFVRPSPMIWPNQSLLPRSALAIRLRQFSYFQHHSENINRYHRVQNTLARVVASHDVPCGTHSFDILQDLHWLPFDQRIEFKHATLTYNILNSSLPVYLRSLLNYHTTIRSLHSANTNLLLVSRVCATFASRSFSIAAPTVWNSLPYSICSSAFADTFRRLLKTHCF